MFSNRLGSLMNIDTIIFFLFSDGNDSDDLIVQAFKAYDVEGRSSS